MSPQPRSGAIRRSCFTSSIAVQSLIYSTDVVSTENHLVHLVYASFTLGDKIFFSEAPVHLFNANIIKSDFLMRLIESTEMLRNLPFPNIFYYKKFGFPDSQGNH